ncbi:hypothetical protein LguiB_028972 [Lonicera macranthoides]
MGKRGRKGRLGKGYPFYPSRALRCKVQRCYTLLTHYYFTKIFFGGKPKERKKVGKH